MAEKIDGIEVHIGANTSDFNKGMASAKTALASFNKDTQKISAGMVAFGSAVGTIFGNVITKAFGSLNREMDGAIARFDSINNFPKVMANLGIGAKDSQAAISTLSDKLLGLPTTLDAGARAVQRFTSANGNVKASTQMFLALNNAILAGGADMSVQSTALEQLSQAYAKGKPDMMEWRSAMTAMPAQLKQVANAMGYVDASALGEALRSGKVSMNDFMATLIKLNKTGINGLPNLATQAKNATGGISTSIVNMKTAIQRGLADIMNAIGQSNIASFFTGVAKAIGTAANYIAAFVKVAVSAAQALASLFGGRAKTSVASNIDAATSAANNLQTSVGGVAGGLNDATGAAKKLKNQLASFDEMNVLNEPDSGGSSSGGGGGSIGDLGNLDFDFDTSKLDKVESEIDKIAKRIKKALEGMFDFDKIGKAIKRFADDVKKFLEPVGRIIGDLWNNYLKPLISWTGNDLLPAFLNALGGAINLIGSVLGKFWDAFLKPFIDAFLVPIAQFTGGIIVSVLNGIGNALRGIAENDDAVYYLAQGVKLLLEAFAAYKIVTVANDAITAFTNSMRIAAAGIPAQQAIIEAGGGAFAKLGAAAGAAKAGVGGLTGVLTGIGEAIFNPMTIAVGGTVAAMNIFEAISIAVKTSQIAATTAEREWITAQEMAEKAVKDQTDAIEEQKRLKDEIAAATENVTNKTLIYMGKQDALTAAQKEADKKLKEYGLTMEDAEKIIKRVEDGDTTLTAKEREVAEAVLKSKQAEDNLKAATTELNTAKDNLATKNTELRDQVLKATAAAEMESAVAKMQKGDFEGLAKQLVDLSNKEVTYQDASGKTVKVSKEATKEMAEFMAEQLGRVDTAQGKFWHGLVNTTGTNLQEMVKITKSMTPEYKQAGIWYCEGLILGLTQNKSRLYSEARSMGLNARMAFNRALGIQSPSKVMMQSGKWFDEGIAIGIAGGEDKIAKVATQVAQTANTSFNDMLNPISDSYTNTLADAGLKIKNSIGETIEANANPHITVKVGEDTLIDKVIDGINQASFLQNRGVINI